MSGSPHPNNAVINGIMASSSNRGNPYPKGRSRPLVRSGATGSRPHRESRTPVRVQTGSGSPSLGPSDRDIEWLNSVDKSDYTASALTRELKRRRIFCSACVAWCDNAYNKQEILDAARYVDKINGCPGCGYAAEIVQKMEERESIEAARCTNCYVSPCPQPDVCSKEIRERTLCSLRFRFQNWAASLPRAKQIDRMNSLFLDLQLHAVRVGQEALLVKKFGTFRIYGYEYRVAGQTTMRPRKIKTRSFNPAWFPGPECQEPKYTPWRTSTEMVPVSVSEGEPETFDVLHELQTAGARDSLCKVHTNKKGEPVGPKACANGLCQLAQRTLRLEGPLTRSGGAHVIEIEAPAAAGKSHFIRENILDGDCLLVPTYDQAKLHMEKIVDGDGKNVTIMTPEVFYCHIAEGAHHSRIFVDEKGLIDKNLLRLAALSAGCIAVFVGHYDQVNWGNRTSYKGPLKQTRPKADTSIVLNRNWRSLPAIVAFNNAMSGLNTRPMRTGQTGKVTIERWVNSKVKPDLRQYKPDFVTGHFQDMKKKGWIGATTHEWQGNEATTVTSLLPSKTVAGQHQFGKYSNYDYVSCTRARDHAVIFVEDKKLYDTMCWASRQPLVSDLPDLIINGQNITVGDSRKASELSVPVPAKESKKEEVSPPSTETDALRTVSPEEEVPDPLVDPNTIPVSLPDTFLGSDEDASDARSVSADSSISRVIETRPMYTHTTNLSDTLCDVCKIRYVAVSCLADGTAMIRQRIPGSKKRETVIHCGYCWKKRAIAKLAAIQSESEPESSETGAGAQTVGFPVGETQTEAKMAANTGAPFDESSSSVALQPPVVPEATENAPPVLLDWLDEPPEGDWDAVIDKVARPIGAYPAELVRSPAALKAVDTIGLVPEAADATESAPIEWFVDEAVEGIYGETSEEIGDLFDPVVISSCACNNGEFTLLPGRRIKFAAIWMEEQLCAEDFDDDLLDLIYSFECPHGYHLDNYRIKLDESFRPRFDAILAAKPSYYNRWAKKMRVQNGIFLNVRRLTNLQSLVRNFAPRPDAFFDIESDLFDPSDYEWEPITDLVKYVPYNPEREEWLRRLREILRLYRLMRQRLGYRQYLCYPYFVMTESWVNWARKNMGFACDNVNKAMHMLNGNIAPQFREPPHPSSSWYGGSENAKAWHYARGHDSRYNTALSFIRSLQNSYNALERERDQLRRDRENLTFERIQLTAQVDSLRRPEQARLHCAHQHADFASEELCRSSCKHGHDDFISEDRCFAAASGSIPESRLRSYVRDYDFINTAENLLSSFPGQHDDERGRWNGLMATMERIPAWGEFGGVYTYGTSTHHCPSLTAPAGRQGPESRSSRSDTDPLTARPETRNPPECVGEGNYQCVKLRHAGVYPEHRTVKNDWLHGLPRYPTPSDLPVTTSVSLMGTSVFAAMKRWMRAQTRTILTTANAKEIPDHDNPFVNFLLGQTDEWSYVDHGSHMEVFYPRSAGGMSGMGLRFWPYLVDQPNPVMVVNGRGNWPSVRDFVGPYRGVQVHYEQWSWYFPAYAGGTLATHGQVKPVIPWLEKMLVRCPDLYGVDECILSLLPQFVFVERHDLFGYVTEGCKTEVDVTFVCRKLHRTIFSISEWSLAAVHLMYRETRNPLSLMSMVPSTTMTRRYDFSDRPLNAKPRPLAITIDDNGGKTLLVKAYRQFVTPTHNAISHFTDCHLSSDEFANWCKERDVIAVIGSSWNAEKFEIIGSLRPTRQVVTDYHAHRAHEVTIDAATFFGDAVELANRFLANKISRDPVAESFEVDGQCSGYDLFPIGFPRDSRFRVTYLPDGTKKTDNLTPSRERLLATQRLAQGEPLHWIGCRIVTLDNELGRMALDLYLEERESLKRGESIQSDSVKNVTAVPKSPTDKRTFQGLLTNCMKALSLHAEHRLRQVATLSVSEPAVLTMTWLMYILDFIWVYVLSASSLGRIIILYAMIPVAFAKVTLDNLPTLAENMTTAISVSGHYLSHSIRGSSTVVRFISNASASALEESVNSVKPLTATMWVLSIDGAWIIQLWSCLLASLTGPVTAALNVFYLVLSSSISLVAASSVLLNACFKGAIQLSGAIFSILQFVAWLIFSVFTNPRQILLWFVKQILPYVESLQQAGLLVFQVVFFVITAWVVWYNTVGYKYQGIVPRELPQEVPLYTSSTNETPATDEDLSGAFCIVTYGTRGDHVPMEYFGRLAAHFGVRTHQYRAHEGDQSTLAQLRRADFTGLRMKYLELFSTGLLPYKRVLQPFVETGGQVDTYSLSPSAKWIKPLNFGGNPTWFSKFASWANESFEPDFRVGSLKEAIFPRSPNGRSLLRKLPRVNIPRRIGWMHGSESKEVIPSFIRDNYDKVPDGDHQVVMREFSEIFSHAGAGTTQTILMSGVTLKMRNICDRNIDRDYHTIPSYDDVSERSPYVFIGYLISRGFVPKMPTLHLVLAYLIYVTANFSILSLFSWLPAVYRVYALVTAIWSPLHTALLVILSIPKSYRLFLANPVRLPLFSIAKFFYDTPILVMAPPIYSIIWAIWLMLDLTRKTIREIGWWFDTRSTIVFTSTHGFPAPFGHVYLLDKRTGKRYEGEFVGKKGWAQKFAWVAKTRIFNNTSIPDREYYQYAYLTITALAVILMTIFSISWAHPVLAFAGLLVSLFVFTMVLLEPLWAKLENGSVTTLKTQYEIPLPFTSNAVERMLKAYGESQAGHYHPLFTCHTIVVPLVYKESVFVAMFFSLVLLFSLSVLVPGWCIAILKPVWRKYNVSFWNVPLDELMDCIAAEAAFAATSRDKADSVESPRSAEFEARLVRYREDGIPEADLPRDEREEAEIIRKWQEDLEAPFTVFEQLQSLIKIAQDPNQPNPLTDEEADHVRAMTIAKYLENHQSLAEKLAQEKNPGARSVIHPDMPPSQFDPNSSNANKYARFLKLLDDFLSKWNGEKYVADVISWIRNQRVTEFGEMVFRIYHAFCFLSRVTYVVSIGCWTILGEAVHCFLSSIFPLEDAKRLKSAWAFAGLTKTPFLSTKRRFQENIAWMSKAPRGDFIESFTDMVDEINAYAERRGAPGLKIQPQYRKINWGRPVLTEEQAKLLGLKPDQYIVDDRNDELVRTLRANGTPVSADTVYLTERIEYIAQSVARYVPRYDPLSPEDKMLAHEIADCFAERFPDNFKDAKTLTPRQVQAYYKAKYAPGSPWISIYKTRQALEDAGITAALFEMVEDRLASGKYPDMFHKAFIKSQVVDIEKVINGNKNVRTVVAEELLTYFMNMCMELERNHRHNWKETGMGIGMPMNQSMVHLFNKLREAKKQHGGMYLIADATEYDSRTRPFTWEFLAKAAEYGYPGKPQASVLRAKYDALQSSFIIRETMPNHHNSVTIITAPGTDNAGLMRRHPRELITAECIHKAFPRLSQDDLYNPNHPVHSLYANKVVLARTKDEITCEDKTGRLRYRLLAPIFVEAVLDTPPANVPQAFQQFSSIAQQNEWILNSVHPNIYLLYNVTQKNRGGGTGENATSWDNGWGYRAAFIAAWVRYHEWLGIEVTPADFFKNGNVLFNTGDDSAITLTNIDVKKFDKELFVKAAHQYGIDLTIDFTDRIEDVEYLGKSVRRPTTEDKEKLTAWQKLMVNEQKSRQQAEITVPEFPKWVVYQRERDSYVRLSSRRYYQNQRGGLGFVHANLQKYAGVATIAVTNPTLWKVVATEYCNDAERLARHYNVPGFKATIKQDQYGMDYIHCTHSSNARTPKQLRAYLKVNRSYRPTRQEEFLVFMESAKFPSVMTSFKHAMDIHTELPVLFQQQTFIQKLEKKSGNLLETTNVIVDYISEELAAIPRFIYKMTANILPATGEPAFASVNYPVENFVAACEFPQTDGFLIGKLARSPWASVTNGFDFFRNLQDDEFLQEHKRHTKKAYGSRLILALVLYCLFYFLEAYLVRVPVFGTLIRLFYAIMIDLPKVYGVVSCLYWHYYGDNSAVISSIMPKDIFIWGKRFAMFIASNLPMWMFDYPISPFYYLYDILAFIVVPLETICQVITSSSQMYSHPGTKVANEPFKNPWDEEIRAEGGRFQVCMAKETTLTLPPVDEKSRPRELTVPQPMILKSAVGSGKSSLAPYALLNNLRFVPGLKETLGNGGRIVLSLPRRILRDKWNSPLENERQKHQRLRKGELIDPSAKILIGTDGHLLNRVLAGELDEKDLYLLDEFHELNGQKVALLQELCERKCRVILPSATPKDIPGIVANIMEANIPRRFAPDIWPISDSLSPADALRQFGGNFVTQWPLSGCPSPEAFKDRVLIKCTYINGPNGCNETLEILQYDQWNCYMLTSENAAEPIPDSAQVVIATDVINTGISLPGFRLMITDGKMHATDKGEARLQWTDPDTQHQGDGRVGRYQAGDVVLRPISAGTGPTPQTYPAMAYLNYSMNAQAHDLPLLGNFKDYATDWTHANYESFSIAPYLGVSKKIHFQVRPFVAALHAIANAGCRENQIRMIYNKLMRNEKVDESYELIEQFLAPLRRTAPLYEQVSAAMSMSQSVVYICRNLTADTQVPLATIRGLNGELLDPVMYQAYMACTNQALIPYQGRLRPITEKAHRIRRDFEREHDTNPSVLYDEALIELDNQRRELYDDLLDLIKVSEKALKGEKAPTRKEKNQVRAAKNKVEKKLEELKAEGEKSLKKLTFMVKKNFALKPDLTHTTINGVQYIHSHTHLCPYCEQPGQHQHVGYNGPRDSDSDERIEWRDSVVQCDNFILFHNT